MIDLIPHKTNNYEHEKYFQDTTMVTDFIFLTVYLKYILRFY